MIRWLPLICGSVIVVAGGYFVLAYAGHRFGLGLEFGLMPLQWIAAGLVGWRGVRYARRRRGGAR